MTTPTFPASETGYWRVSLTRPVWAGGFRYLPGFDAIRADEATLVELLAEDAEAGVEPIAPTAEDAPALPAELAG